MLQRARLPALGAECCRLAELKTWRSQRARSGNGECPISTDCHVDALPGGGGGRRILISDLDFD
jgi:hypothetical protein